MTLAAVFGSDMLIVALVVGGGIVVPLWAIFDALSRPAGAFSAAGSHKTAWVIVLLVMTFVLGIGLFLGAFYLLSVRPRVRQQMLLISRT